MLASIILAAATNTFAQKATDNFNGTWKTEEGKTVIIKNNSKKGFEGHLDGKYVLKDIAFANGKWTGAIIDASRDITAKCEMKFEGNKLKIVAKKGPFSKTIYWTKSK